MGCRLRTEQANSGKPDRRNRTHGYVPRPRLAGLTGELKNLIKELTDEETEMPRYKRRILHGKIDILRAELVNRPRHKHDGGDAPVITGDDVQQLTNILASRQTTVLTDAE